MKKKKQEKEELEVTLGTKQCAEVALFMLKEYQKEMEKPQFMIPSFGDWLRNLITRT